MVMPRLSERETEPEQPLPIVRICWDELFRFLRDLFKPKATRAWTALGSLDAETTTNYKLVFETAIPSGFEGQLEMITFYSSRPDTTQWFVEIAGQEAFKDQKLYAALTLPYASAKINTLQKIAVRAKTDGVATDIVAALSGQLIFLGK